MYKNKWVYAAVIVTVLVVLVTVLWPQDYQEHDARDALPAEPAVGSGVRRAENTVESAVASDRIEVQREISGLGVSVRNEYTDEPISGMSIGIWILRQQLDRAVAAGRMSTDGSGEAVFVGLEAGDYYVRASGANKRHPLPVRVESGAIEWVELSLRPDIRAKGIVVDRDGRAIPDAEIWLGRAVAQSRGMSPICNADDRGRFDVAFEVNPGLIGARASGYGPSALQLLMSVGSREAELELVLPEPGGDLGGRVTKGGLPIRGAAVQIGAGSWDVLDAMPGGAPSQYAVRLLTDTDGRWELRGCSPGEHPLVIETEGYAVWRGSGTVSIGGKAQVTSELEPGTVVYGVVTDTGGAYVSGAQVQAAIDGAEFGARQSVTDDVGAYRLAGVGSGEVGLSVAHPIHGFASATVGLDKETREHVWSPTLEVGWVFRGRVIDEQGAPVAGAVVRPLAYFAGGEVSDRRSRSVVTDEDGGFSLSGRSDEVSVDLAVSSSGFVTKHVKRVDVSDADLDVIMERVPVARGRVWGSVFASDGQPAAHALIMLEEKRGAPGGRCFQVDPATGRLDRMVVPGVYRITVHSGSPPERAEMDFSIGVSTGWTEVMDGGEWWIGDIVMERGGRVRAATASELGIVHIAIRQIGDASGDYIYLMPSGNGRYLSPPVAPGVYDVCVGAASGVAGKPAVMAARGRVPTVDIAEGGVAEVELDLTPGVWVDTELVGADRFGESARVQVRQGEAVWPLTNWGRSEGLLSGTISLPMGDSVLEVVDGELVWTGRVAVEGSTKRLRLEPK